MLTNLSIRNYALIEDISIDFSKGLTTISGETGAGKSILLGGLGLILGNRATTKSLMNPHEKCVIEGEFDISKYKLLPFFEQNDIDFEAHTIIRRELLPSGKSRAFINDTPVRLDLLSKLQNSLIDVHSQHQTLQLNDTQFQFNIVDALANTQSQIDEYTEEHVDFVRISQEYAELKEKIQQESEQFDYHSFLYAELEQANFKIGEQHEIEQEIERLSNIELIKQNLSESYNILSDDELGILSKLYQVKSNLSKIENFAKIYKSLSERLDSLHIETKDIEEEIAALAEGNLSDDANLEKYNSRLQLLFQLYQKHKVNAIEELQEIQSDLSEKVNQVSNATSILQEKESEVLACRERLLSKGKGISEKREKATPLLEEKLTHILQELGMPHAQFGITIKSGRRFYKNGIDELEFLFSANKGGKLSSLKLVASGGELSRIMLAVKSIMASHTQLPTIIFDEIDTGVSGEIALKIAQIMRQMAESMQVVSITHLPQIAARGMQHMKVYKNVSGQQSKTNIKLLQTEDRILEIAEMLGGKTISETAVNHAKQLLK